MLKIISGGQTGADRAGLDFALKHGLECGGWCPKGRLSEDGVIPDMYPLQETPHPNYPERTEWNVRDSDGTIIFCKVPMGRGSALTENLCKRLGKPYMIVTASDTLFAAVAHLIAFIQRHKIAVLNVAGSRDQVYYNLANSVLSRAWIDLNKVEHRDEWLRKITHNKSPKLAKPVSLATSGHTDSPLND